MESVFPGCSFCQAPSTTLNLVCTLPMTTQYQLHCFLYRPVNEAQSHTVRRWKKGYMAASFRASPSSLSCWALLGRTSSESIGSTSPCKLTNTQCLDAHLHADLLPTQAEQTGRETARAGAITQCTRRLTQKQTVVQMHLTGILQEVSCRRLPPEDQAPLFSLCSRMTC